MLHHHLRKDCRLCGSHSLVKVLELAPTPPANSFVDKDHLFPLQDRYPLDLYFCNTCTHVQLCDVVDPQILFEHYVYVSGTSPAYRKHLHDYAQDVMARYMPSADCEVLEIGSNDGTFLAFFQKKGLPVHGIDPAQNIVDIANANGVPTTATFFGQETALRLKRQGHTPGVVLANHVFAHIDDLRGVMVGVADLLSRDGYFIFEVSYLLAVVEKLLFDTIYHEHVAYHSVKALVYFLDLYDFELVEVQEVAHQGGSLRCFAQRKGGALPVTASVSAFLAREKAAQLDDLSIYRDYAHRLDVLKTQLSSLLCEIKEKGQTIAGFGAPAKATTLMHHFGLDGSVIDFIADDNPLKQGTFTPGWHVPVLPASAIYERRPDYVLLLAWNFADSIMSMQKRYLEEGGRFIIPLPELRVVGQD